MVCMCREPKVKALTAEIGYVSDWALMLMTKQPEPVFRLQVINQAGDDLGLDKFETPKAGQYVAPYKPFAQNRRRVAGTLGTSSKEGKKCSRNRSGFRPKRSHKKDMRQSNVFFDMASQVFVKESVFIAPRDANAREMVQKSKFSKSIGDHSWSKLGGYRIQISSTDTKSVPIHPKSPSQMRAKCGVKVKIPLSAKIKYPSCSFSVVMVHITNLNTLKRLVQTNNKEFTPGKITNLPLRGQILLSIWETQMPQSLEDVAFPSTVLERMTEFSLSCQLIRLAVDAQHSSGFVYNSFSVKRSGVPSI
jgi:hypothetical protein